MTDSGYGRRRTRRGVLALGTSVAGLVAGCSSPSDTTGGPTNEAGAGGGAGDGQDHEHTDSPFDVTRFRGSGPMVSDRGPIEGPSIQDLPPLSGELSIYLGGGEGGLYTELLDRFGEIYPDFQPSVRSAGSAQLANTIIEEGQAGASEADCFWSIDAGALAAVADAGVTTALSAEAVDPVPDPFHPDDQWVGTAGRARAVAYNTEQLTADDVPDAVQSFPETDALQPTGWAPAYGAFQSFVTAMRLLRGEDETRQWLQGMVDAGTTTYADEFLVSNAVADGELAAGFANHYYALRVQASRPDAPIDLAFTSGDAGALINTAGVAKVGGTERSELVDRFVRHLLSVEAQEFFATRTFAYPMIPGVPPVGGLPTIDELSPPDVDLAKLSDVEPTLRVLRDAGLL